MSQTSPTKNAWATGLAVFAAALMVTIGVLQFLQGLVAIIDDEFYVVGPEYIYQFDTTTWGWIHLLLGVLLMATGGFLFGGSGWSRGVGIGLAVLAIIANFMWLPYYPWWSIIVIGLSIAIIWALAVFESPEV